MLCMTVILKKAEAWGNSNAVSDRLSLLYVGNSSMFNEGCILEGNSTE